MKIVTLICVGLFSSQNAMFPSESTFKSENSIEQHFLESFPLIKLTELLVIKRKCHLSSTYNKDNRIPFKGVIDKYGGEFWITISKCPTENIRTLLGNPIEPNKATAWNFGNQHVPGNKGFPYNKFNDLTKFEALAQQSLSYIDEAERWWRGELVKKKGIFGYLKNKFKKNT